jgi:hypothetical protein
MQSDPLCQISKSPDDPIFCFGSLLMFIIINNYLVSIAHGRRRFKRISAQRRDGRFIERFNLTVNMMAFSNPFSQRDSFLRLFAIFIKILVIF